MSRSAKLFWFIVLIVVAVAAWWFFGRGHGADQAAPPAMPPGEVSVLDVRPADVALSYEYAGRAAGSREVEIRARATGILQKRTYTEGQPVKQGDVLFEIEPTQLQSTLSEARARLQQAQRDWDRVQQLFAQQAISARERDEAQAAYEAAKAQARTAQTNFSYTTVTAPITGVTSEESLSEGSLVTADQTLLTKITQVDPLYINFAYPETDFANLRHQLEAGTVTMPAGNKLTATIRFGDGRDYPQAGTVDFTDSIVDLNTGTVQARATLPNADNAIFPGAFVRVIVSGFTRPNTITVPDQAVMQGPQGTFLWAVDANSHAQPKPVVLGQLVGKDRVIESGLAANDRIIVEGMIKARPDAEVKVTKETQAGTPAAAQAEQAQDQAVQGQKSGTPAGNGSAAAANNADEAGKGGAQSSSSQDNGKTDSTEAAH